MCGGAAELHSTAAGDQLGGDLDLQGFFKEGLLLISVSIPLTLVEKRDKCCSPLGVLPMFWFYFGVPFFLSLECYLRVGHFSTAPSFPRVTFLF